MITWFKTLWDFSFYSLNGLYKGRSFYCICNISRKYGLFWHIYFKIKYPFLWSNIKKVATILEKWHLIMKWQIFLFDSLSSFRVRLIMLFSWLILRILQSIIKKTIFDIYLSYQSFNGFQFLNLLTKLAITSLFLFFAIKSLITIGKRDKSKSLSC